MDSSDGTRMTPDLPPRVGTPDLAGQGGPRPDGRRERHGEAAAADPAGGRRRGHRKAPRHSVR